jgi:hypothetical protein
MVAEMTDIKGIGPSKAETLAEHGYDSVEALANADPDELADVKGVGSDRALEYKVGAEDVLEASEEVEEKYPEEEGDEFDLKPSEVGEELEEAQEVAERDVSASDDEDDQSDVEDEESAQDATDAAEEKGTDESEESVYDVEFDFDNQMQYDVFHAALMRHNERVSHQPATDLMEKCLSGLYGNEKGVTYQFTEYELNTLHAAVKQARTNFQGANDIEQMDALKEIEAQLDAARKEYLF